jgi:hypothetical protein
MYFCRCECGTEKMVRPNSLHREDSKSCGCMRGDILDGNKFIGKKYGHLTILRRLPKDENNKYFYEAQCECGKTKKVRIGQITNGHIKSCSCKSGVWKLKGESGFNLLFGEYKRGALSRGYSFELTSEEFRNITRQNCHYCGCKPSQIKHLWTIKSTHGDYTYNGIDRIVNTKGYTIENCVPCCKTCNIAKGKLTQEEFVKMAFDISNNLFIKRDVI